MRKKSLRFKNGNGFIVLFIVFVIILSALFIYLQKIDRDLRMHHQYRADLEEIILLDQQLDNVFLQKYQYLDYDAITGVTGRLEELFDGFVSQRIYERHADELSKLRSFFEKKRHLTEDFKSLNSRMTNAVHYMYDLRRSIKSTELNGLKKKTADEIFFQVTQLIMGIQIDREILQNNLMMLRSLVTEGCKCDYFLTQVSRFLKDFDVMQGYMAENHHIGFSDRLREVLSKLEHGHAEDIQKQKTVALLFFGMAFFVLLLLMVNYRKVIRATRELLAFRYAIENSDNIVLITDTNRNITYVNEAFEVHTGYKKDEVIGSQPNILKSDMMDKAFYAEMNATLEKGEKWQGELINRRKDGSLLYEKASISPIVVNGKIVQYLAIKLDITEYIEYQNRLKQSATVFENTQEGILILDEEKRIDSLNQAFLEMTDFDEKRLYKKPLEFFASEKHDATFYQRIWHTIAEDGEWSGKVYISRSNGEVIPIWLSLTTVYGNDQKIINYIAIYTDLSEVIRTQEKADFLAYHDSLTLLPNRAHFERYMQKLFEDKNLRNKVAVMFLDLDRFKVINDTLGHSVGDELLKEVSQRILEVIGDTFFLARLGGDEFVIVLDGVISQDTVSKYAEEILNHISQLMIVNQHQLSVSGSLGISLYPDHSDDPNTLIRYADSAMYSAKEQGKNTYAYYEEQLSLDVHSRLNIEQLLKVALENKEISLRYQPQYTLDTHEVIGAEVLVRWNNRLLGNVPPAEFIPIAEDTGMIIEIGYYIFEEACRTFMEWTRQGVSLQRVSLNLSSVQLGQHDFLEKIREIMEKTGIRGEKIEVELTERIFFEFSSSNLKLLNEFRKMGCEIAIDDFGTGYSSMSYLKDLPIDTVKIDKAFINELPTNIHDQKVVKAMIALSRSLGYKVIAEGIETEEQEALLCESRCDIGQGYYFSRPLDQYAFLEFLEVQKSKKK
ncbi:EAL domain-containing protein [Sulfurovum mangrovi]|uniref:EAL domain-containing protein n=1 Tax=Sulfurovum mangrovi TaxID=2893889 RepID=UPI001E4DE6CA|nr:EAL domain-containing protein [Sulfurovum mangrovi]UFH59934.1 EAL domain-containing protein [Sulfurovum mangrovi]